MIETRRDCPQNAENCPHARESAEIAVKRVFAILGVDIDVPKEVEEFRKDLRAAASMRRIADRGMLAIIGTMVVGLLAVLWTGIVAKIGGGQ